MRALIVVRLSRMTDSTTSPERQLESCEELCRLRSYEIVGVAEDLDVSGAVDPFEVKHRPNLARWLAGEHEQFDVIVAYRVDRLTRSIRHLQKLVAWAEDNGKLVVSATEPHFDMTSPFAAVVIALMGTVAQMELEAISARSASAKQRDIRLGKYRGGTPPWGYKPQRDDAGVWRLVHDDEQVKVIREVVTRVSAREPLQRIAHDLTRRSIPTPKDRALQLQGKPMKGTSWNITPLKRSLLSEAMLGRVSDAGGNSLRSDDGSPILRADPVLTRDEFEALRVELASRSKRGEPTARSTSLLLRVIHCSICKLPAYKFNGGSHSQFPRYRCKSMTSAHKCGNRTVRLDEADRLVEKVILRMLGESERRERVRDPGTDNSAELTEVNEIVTDLTSLVGTDVYRAGTPQRAQLDARIAGYAARQAELAAEEVRPAGWTWEPTGELFGDWWARQNVTARNVWLRSMNVRLEFGPQGFWLDLGDLETLTGQMAAAGRAADWRKIFDQMRDNDIQGMTIGPDGGIEFTHQDGRTLRVDAE